METNTNYHLVILKKPYLEAILEGRKRIESRFTRTRRSYFGRVFTGDVLFLKESSGPVCGVASVSKVKNFADLTREKVFEIKRRYNHDIAGRDEHWQSKADCRFGVLVWLVDVKRIESVRIDKKDWRAWVVLTEEKNFGLLRLLGRNRRKGELFP